MTTSQRVLSFVAGLALVFAVGLGLGSLVDLDRPEPAIDPPGHGRTPTPGAPVDHDEMEMPDVDD